MWYNSSYEIWARFGRDRDENRGSGETGTNRIIEQGREGKGERGETSNLGDVKEELTRTRVYDMGGSLETGHTRTGRIGIRAWDMARRWEFPSFYFTIKANLISHVTMISG
ncbi:hypothetical protein QC760_007444 [Botrytis cinerea]